MADAQQDLGLGTARIVVYQFGNHLLKGVGTGQPVRVGLDSPWNSMQLQLVEAAYQDKLPAGTLDHIDPETIFLYLLPSGEELTDSCTCQGARVIARKRHTQCPPCLRLTTAALLADHDRIVVFIGPQPLEGDIMDPSTALHFAALQPFALRPGAEVQRELRLRQHGVARGGAKPQPRLMRSLSGFTMRSATQSEQLNAAGSVDGGMSRSASVRSGLKRVSSASSLTDLEPPQAAPQGTLPQGTLGVALEEHSSGPPSLSLSSNAKLRRVVRKLVLMNRMRKVNSKPSLASTVSRTLSAKRGWGLRSTAKTMDAYIREQSNIYSYNEQRVAEEQRLPWHIVDPESTAKVAWDFLVLMLVMFYGVVVPYRLGFQVDGSETEQVLDDIANVIFMIDIVASFRTAYKEDGVLIKDPHRIAQRYARSWFIIDLVASIPLDWFVDTKGGINKLLRSLRLFKLFRMLRLLKLFPRLFQVLETNIKFNPSMIRFMRSFIIMLLMWHCIACAYWWVVRIEYGGYYQCSKDPDIVCWVNKCVCVTAPFDPNEVYEVLVDIPDEDYDPNWASDLPPDDWVPDVHSANRPESYKYAQALFWAVEVTTGIGDDIIPKTQLEVSFTSSMVVVGLMMYSLIIGSASSALANMDSTATQRRQTLDKVSAYMRSRRVPSFFQRIIVDFYQHMWTTPMKESDVFRDLPDSLRSRLSMVLNRDLIDRIPIFQHMPADVYIRLVQKLLHNTFLPGEFVIRQGDTPRCIYFVKRGMADAILPTGGLLMSYEPGDFFGEHALLQNRKRSLTVRAVDFLDVLQLRREHFMELFTAAPAFLAEIRRVDATRQQFRLAKELELVRVRLGMPRQRRGSTVLEHIQAARGLKSCMSSVSAVEPARGCRGKAATESSPADPSMSKLRRALDGGEKLGGIASQQAYTGHSRPSSSPSPAPSAYTGIDSKSADAKGRAQQGPVGDKSSLSSKKGRQPLREPRLASVREGKHGAPRQLPAVDFQPPVPAPTVGTPTEPRTPSEDRESQGP